MDPFLNPESAVLRLCIESTRAEFAGRPQEARELAQQAWTLSQGPLEAGMAAHYVARYEPDPHERLRWNQQALSLARQADPDLIAPWLPSLYLNLGRAHEALGDVAAAQSYYALAAELGLAHDADDPDAAHRARRI